MAKGIVGGIDQDECSGSSMDNMEHYYTFRRTERVMRCEMCQCRMNTRAAEIKPCPKRELDQFEVEARLGAAAWPAKKVKRA